MSLPAEWIKTLGLKKGDILSIEIMTTTLLQYFRSAIEIVRPRK